MTYTTISIVCLITFIYTLTEPWTLFIPSLKQHTFLLQQNQPSDIEYIKPKEEKPSDFIY